MKKQWFKNRKRIITDGKRMLCNECPCGFAWIAVGEGYKIYTSKDGINWTTASLYNLDPIYNIRYNGTMWVQNGYRSGYPYVVLTSLDGKNWTPRTTSYNISSRGICWGNNLWVIGHSARLSTSPDGINWTLHGPFESNVSSINDITWNGSLFVAVSGGRGYLTSPDGVNWTEREFSIYNPSCWRVVWNGSLFVVSGGGYVNGEPCCIQTSPNGTDWTPVLNIDYYAYGLCWNGYLFVAGTYTGQIITSPDGTNWTVRNSPFYDEINGGTISDIAWDGSLFVAVGRIVVSGEGKIATSPDGINWTERLTPSDSVWGVASAKAPNLYPPIGV